MDSLSDSDSKDDSVIESVPMSTVKCVNDVVTEDKEIPNVQKKEKFKSFYHTQKTICAESNSNSLDFDGQNMMKESEDLNDEEEEDDNPKLFFEEVLEDLAFPIIPKIRIKRLSKRKKDSPHSDDDSTDHSELHLNEKEKAEILDNHEKPSINASLEPCVSHVTQKNKEYDAMDCLDVGRNTSEDEVSEILSDVPHPPKAVKNGLPRKGQKKLARSMTVESDIVVSDLDYYKIRHETKVNDGTEFSLATTNQYIKTSNSKGKSNGIYHCTIPCIKIVDISNGTNGQDKNDTSDEDVPCTESDFMSKSEFMEAHKANLDLSRKESRLQVSHSLTEKSDSESDGEITESLRENLDSDDSLSNIESDYEENLPEHSADCVETKKIQHSEDCKFMNFIKSFDTYNDEDLNIVDDEPASSQKIEDEEEDDFEYTNAVTDEDEISELELQTQDTRKSLKKSSRRATSLTRNTKKI